MWKFRTGSWVGSSINRERWSVWHLGEMWQNVIKNKFNGGGIILSKDARHKRIPTLHYITLHYQHFKRHLHLKWPVVHQQLHVIRNTAHRPSTQASYTASRVRPKRKISCAAAQIAATQTAATLTISLPRWRHMRLLWYYILYVYNHADEEVSDIVELVVFWGRRRTEKQKKSDTRWAYLRRH